MLGLALAIPSAALSGALTSQGVVHTVADTSLGTRFGSALDLAGDCDGDGRPDLVVGAWRTGGGAGAVHLLSGAGGALLWSLQGGGSHRLGYDVAGAGDLDGDGLPDVLVGAPYEAGGAGVVRALSGLDGHALWSVTGSGAGGRLGQSVAGLGDLDGDGVGDLAAGAPFDGGNGTYAGRVELRSGADGTLLFALGGAAFDQFGFDVAGVGDLDGDGAGDCAIGAPFDDRGGFNAGALVVVSGATGTRMFELFGSAAGDWLGHRVAGAGDVDRDGVPDLLVGVPGADLAGLDSGGAEVRSGAHGGLLFRVPGEVPGEYLMAVAGAGDVDGDGAADVLVGAASGGAGEAGRARLISGRTRAVLCSFDGLGPKAWFGAAVSPAGDVDGDGIPDLASGAPGHDDETAIAGYVQVLTCTPGGPWQIHASQAPKRAPSAPPVR